MDTHEPLSKGTSDGIKCVCDAARIRQYEVYYSISADISDKTNILTKDVVFWHQKCYQSYTSKTNLAHVTHSTSDKSLDNAPVSEHRFSR